VRDIADSPPCARDFHAISVTLLEKNELVFGCDGTQIGCLADGPSLNVGPGRIRRASEFVFV
jgi:hypothetical protein